MPIHFQEETYFHFNVINQIKKLKCQKVSCVLREFEIHRQL
jgi:hypothetical protein